MIGVVDKSCLLPDICLKEESEHYAPNSVCRPDQLGAHWHEILSSICHFHFLGVDDQIKEFLVCKGSRVVDKGVDISIQNEESEFCHPFLL